MRSQENILIIERVMQKHVPDREVKVSITITELCKFIEAARVDERRNTKNAKGQYEAFCEELGQHRYKKYPKEFEDLFGKGGFGF